MTCRGLDGVHASLAAVCLRRPRIIIGPIEHFASPPPPLRSESDPDMTPDIPEFVCLFLRTNAGAAGSAQTVDSGKAKAQLRPPARPRVAHARAKKKPWCRETVARNTGSSGANSNSIYDGAARDSKRFFLTPRTFPRGRSYYSRDRSNKEFASPTFPSVADQTWAVFNGAESPYRWPLVANWPLH